MDHATEPVSIRFENCLSRQNDPAIGGSREWPSARVKDDGPQGLIEFINCVSENTGAEGVKVYDKSANAALVRFVHCKWSNPWTSARPQWPGPRVPVLIESRLPR